MFGDTLKTHKIDRNVRELTLKHTRKYFVHIFVQQHNIYMYTMCIYIYPYNNELMWCATPTGLSTQIDATRARTPRNSPPGNNQRWCRK